MQLLKQFKHVMILPIYGFFYIACFVYLEKTNHIGSNINIIYSKLDDYIPFCEYFIVPYLLWFIYVATTVVYLLIKNRTDYYQFIIYLFTGMTIFLIVSFLYPNGQNLRPDVFPRENMFTEMVRALYRSDTPTNILPSIHVYNSIATHVAIARNDYLRKKPVILYGSFLLMTLIILATMFLKQHSVIDVITGTLLAGINYVLIYKIQYSFLKKSPGKNPISPDNE